MRRFLAACLVAVSLLTLSNAWASFHTFVIDQLYSNGDGSVQFIVLHEASGFGGQNFLVGHSLQSSGPGGPKTFNFPGNLPSSNTAGKRALIGTAGFAALGIVSPDYVVPNGFLSLSGGSLNYAGVDSINYAALPTDGVNALYRNGSVAPNLATNFDGASASVTAPGPTVVNYQGLWWKSPGASEDGWGINFAHQGKTIFGTWFTYDTTGKGWWLTLITDDSKSTATAFEGDLFATTGPPFNTIPFVKTGPPPPPIGSATLTFTDANNGSLHYDVNLPTGTVSQTKAITRQPLGSAPMATCTSGGPPTLAAATNYQDIWWAGTSASPGTEQGWGINFAQQGDVVFASWFTYDLDGTPLWLVATLSIIAPGIYQGDLFRPSGPRFDAYDKSQFRANPAVGTLKLTITDGNNASINYTLQLAGMANSVTQTKIITRQLFSASGTTCQ